VAEIVVETEHLSMRFGGVVAVDGVDFADQLAALLAPIVAPGGSLVLEHATRTDAPSVRGFASGDTRRYGDTSLTFYGKD